MANGKFVISKDAAGEFRWLLREGAGKPIADSAGGFNTHADCLKNVHLVIQNAKTAAVEDTTGHAPAPKGTPAGKKKAAQKKTKKK